MRDDHVQKLICGRLQSNHKVNYEGKDHDREECYRHIDKRESSRFNKWVVHGRFGMFHHNGPLREERRDFGHRR
jgi:hypothetical protein